MAGAGLGLSLAGSSAWLWLMHAPAPWLSLGRICGHAASQLHCPLCYVAAAAAVIGLAIAAPELAARPAPARARS
jgi:hypothetical protein